MPTITNRLRILIDQDGTHYFSKCDPLERKQLALLDSLKLPVPPVVIDIRDGEFASIDCGRSLCDILRTEGAAAHILPMAGRLLGLTHFQFEQRTSDIPVEILRSELAHTAHITRSFRARYMHSHIECFTSVVEQCTSRGIRHLTPLISCLADCAEHLAPRANTSDGGQVIYGDFKPDNIVVKERDLRGTHLTLIDPHICLGDRRFDVAKFISRVLLEPNGARLEDVLSTFNSSYRGIFHEDGIGAVPVSLRDLVAMDSLNVLSSYLLCALRGDEGFRLVASLQAAEYREYLTWHLERLVFKGAYEDVLNERL